MTSVKTLTAPPTTGETSVVGNGLMLLGDIFCPGTSLLLEGRIKEGGILFSVHCDDGDWSGKAKEILKHYGAEDISSTSEASSDHVKGDTHDLPRAV